MGHSVNFCNGKYGKNAKEIEQNKARLLSVINEECIHYSDNHGGLPSRMEWFNKEFDSYDDAEEWLENYASGKFYPEVACTYKRYETKSSAKSERIEKKIKETSDKEQAERKALEDYMEKNSAKNRKSVYVGCPKCGSKLHKDYVVVNPYWKQMPCPLCKEDLFSDTVKTRILKYKESIAALGKSVEQLQKDLEVARRTSKYELRWLVRYEYHC